MKRVLKNKPLQNLAFFAVPILATVMQFSLGEPVKIDMDARKDATAEGFVPWLPENGTAKAVDGLTFSFELISPPPSTNWAIGWDNKAGLNAYELAMDCLYCKFDDGTASHPSFEGGSLLLTIRGLSGGIHTLTSYHNAPWPVSKYGRAISRCTIYVNEKECATVQPSQGVTKDSDMAAAFLTFEAIAEQPVRVRFEPVDAGADEICTSVLNAFEIDSSGPPGAFASNPNPADGDEHVFAGNDDPVKGEADNGHVQLIWQASESAEHHDIYFGTRRSDVQGASTDSTEIYKGRQKGTQPTWNAGGLSSEETYYWRVDTVENDGSVVKGPVWSFRVRRLAYKKAEGYGRFARGGRFGRVYEVTTLADYNPDAGEPVIDGSLRKAVEMEKGARVVVFRSGGTIFLKKKLTVPPDGGDVYVAGQTAPGDGICVARYSFGMLGAKNVIIRHVRTRVGDYAKTSLDGMGMARCDHCIIDHCSISWSIDEGVSSRGAMNITFSRNIVAEALNRSYQYADHSYAGSISGNRGSFHHNLLAHCAGRNWSLAGGLTPNGQYDGFCDIRNNVVYNWKHRTTDGGVMRCNFVNNLYLPGPAGTHFLLMRPDGDQMRTGNPQMFYIHANKIEGYPQYDTDNWAGVKPNFAETRQIRSNEPFFPSYVVTHDVNDLFLNVINDVGATRPKRDAIDRRIVEDVLKRSYTYKGSKTGLPGIIDSQTDVGGYPEMKDGPAAQDSDHDGLPDWWELKRGLNLKSRTGDYADTNADPDRDGYTNMEDYLEYLAEGGSLNPT